LDDDPRRVLEDAARRRLSCEILPRRGEWCQGCFVRVEKAGVVLVAPGGVFSGGEDVRVWFSADGQPWTFEASVLRAGVPVPDRSQRGLMLGFIDGWTRGEGARVRSSPASAGDAGASPTAAPSITVLPPNGRGLELLEGTIRLVSLRVDELAFSVPRAEPLKFVEGGTVRIRFRRAGHPDHVVSGVVRKLAPGDGHYFYGIRFIEVADPVAHPGVIESVRQATTA
jgi:hypothetical protein